MKMENKISFKTFTMMYRIAHKSEIHKKEIAKRWLG